MHYVQAFVGSRQILELIQRQFGASLVVDLKQRMAILPLLDELYDAIPGDASAPVQEKFLYLTPKIVEVLKQTSLSGKVGYFETDYAGGGGDQGAILARQEEITFGPVTGADSINQMLARMDVKTSGDKDEFDAVGLGRFRNNKDWINQPNVGGTPESATLTGSLISWIHGLGKK